MAKKVLLGVTGCIAAYKIPELTRLFIKKGYQVKVILTDCAKKFVTETTMQTLSKNPVYTDIFEPKDGWFPSMVQRNLSLLQEIERYHVIAPEEGFLACLSNGPGRLPDPPEIIKVVESL